jgi:flagellar L-ring protein precursor FlgH
MKYFLILPFFFSGCATMYSFFGMEPPKKEVVVKVEPVKEPLTKYSDVNNYAPVADRNYKRMTREKFEEDAELQAGAGSLWVMDGQTSYLFAQNKKRREGDATTLLVQGMALKDVEMKAFAVKDLLIELENQKKEAELKKKKEEDNQKRLAEINREKKLILDKGEADNEEAAQVLAEQRIDSRKPASLPVAEAPKDPALDKIDLKEIEQVPMKIVERLPDNQYRVSGQQFMTIRKRTYKLVVAGIVRGDDFSDQSITSDKMFDQHFELLHLKKAE